MQHHGRLRQRLRPGRGRGGDDRPRLHLIGGRASLLLCSLLWPYAGLAFGGRVSVTTDYCRWLASREEECRAHLTHQATWQPTAMHATHWQCHCQLFPCHFDGDHYQRRPGRRPLHWFHPHLWRDHPAICLHPPRACDWRKARRHRAALHARLLHLCVAHLQDPRLRARRGARDDVHAHRAQATLHNAGGGRRAGAGRGELSDGDGRGRHPAAGGHVHVWRALPVRANGVSDHDAYE
mmetsp:Transcript_4631/g.10177  ORF Transcript_4631/g.10177 Transcript_4631/m.10177 type:complete len:237 (-) Transcript_4631:1071-1781(-)